jgi:poly(A) polymerase
MPSRPSSSSTSSGLARGIYPLLDVVVERADQPFVRAALQDTDRRVGEGKPVAPSFLLACVLWADVRDGWAQRQEGRHGQRAQPPFPALQDAIDDVFNSRIGDVSGRGKLAADMREIWMMQPRFDKRTGSTPYSLVEQARFRAAFDFMRLRADVGEVSEAIAEWWQEFSTADDLRRQDLLEQVREEQKVRQRVRVRETPPPKPRSEPAGHEGSDSDSEDEPESRGRCRAARWRGRAAQAPAPPQAAPLRVAVVRAAAAPQANDRVRPAEGRQEARRNRPRRPQPKRQ